MRMMLASLLLILMHAASGNCAGAVFLQRSTALSLPHDFPVGATFYRLQAVDSGTGRPVERGLLLFQVLRSAAFPPESRSGRGLFTVDEHTGSLMLSPHRRHSLAEYVGSTFALDIVAISSTRPSENATHATIVISISKDNFASPDCAPKAELCFPGPEVQLQIPETVDNSTLLITMKPIPYKKLCPNVHVKYSIDTNENLSLSSPSGNLWLQKQLDFEDRTEYVYNMSCEIENDNSTSELFFSVLRIYVLDADDNAPYAQSSSRLLQQFDADEVIPGKALPAQLTVLDADTAAVNDIRVSIVDPLSLFRLRDPVIFHGVNGSHILLNTALVPKNPFQFPKSSYNVSVIFTDNSLIGETQENEVVFHIQLFNSSTTPINKHVPNTDFQVVAKVFRHSSRHSRVIQPMEVKPHDGYFFRLIGEPEGGLVGSPLFGVTPATGIVYVRDEVGLARSYQELFELKLTWRNREETDRICFVKIKVLDAGDITTVCGVEPGHQYPSCALHATAQSCASSCGRGASDGFCRWRSHSTTAGRGLTNHYATCSPHLDTCPDGTCDELELMDPMLCPQDCAANVRGEAVPHPTGRGIEYSAATCTCTSPNTCVCVRFPSRSQKMHRSSAYKRHQNAQHDKPEIVPASSLNYQDEWTECGTGCAAMIAAVSLVVTGLVASAALLVCKRRASRTKDTDFNGVDTPLNPTLRNIHQDIKNEEKLDFPRNQLSLEETIGEGEYGKVVKAKASNIAGIPGTTTVAVKMLKDGSLPFEQRDLMTELNLLKDVSHPNVIRLLGACTDNDGPLYVIMEYAEHGSLITFLRKMRARYPHVQGEIRELINFAWQIAKGMEYLAEMKIVHRDLAARNVLVADGKIMKISDFGLSRDVYERASYTKATNGRIPVKWMAIESLQNQMYTTKSDVWSFGVLLWEIITLGGCPYPGIAAEQLFKLLKEGYRMPRPDDCPIQIYQLMTICWREKPYERPHFKDLVRKLEFLLNDSMHYLPPKEESPPTKKFKRAADEPSVVTQLVFPKMSTVAYGPYESRRLLSSPTECSV